MNCRARRVLIARDSETTVSDYDVIGDIHGHASHLRGLLAAMDYAEVDGVLMHPTRTAVFDLPVQ